MSDNNNGRYEEEFEQDETVDCDIESVVKNTELEPTHADASIQNVVDEFIKLRAENNKPQKNGN